MAHLMQAPRFTQDKREGSRRWVTKDGDGILASDHSKRTELPVEPD